MVKIYAAAGGMESIEVIADATLVRETATGAIANYSIGTIRLGSTTAQFRVRTMDPDTNVLGSVAAGSVWLHTIYRLADFNQNNGGVAAGRLFQACKSDGTPIARVRLSATPYTYVLERWTGAAWVAATTPNATFVFANAADLQLDMEIKIHATTGLVRLYYNKAVVFEMTGLDTSTWNVAWYDFFSPSTQSNTVNDTSFQQIIVADSTTLDLKLKRRPIPTGAGGSTAMTGTYADVDEYPASDTDFLTSTVTGDAETVQGGAFAALPALTEVKAVVVAARIRNDGGTSPQNVKGVVNVGGVDYAATGNMRISTAFGGAINIFPLNPATAAAWAALPAATDAYGLKSAA